MINQVHKFWLPLTIAACAILASGIYYSPPLLNENLIDDDVFQHLFWMDQYSDDYYFQEDLLKEYARAVQPIGPAAIYRISQLMISSVQLSKILPVPLFVLSVLLMYFIGNRLGGRFNGALSAATLMATPGYLIKMEGGLPRSFALPLLLLFLLLMLHKKYVWSSVVVVVQALFYPLIAPVGLLVLTAGIFLPIKKVSWTGLKKSLLPMTIACLGCLALFMHQSRSAKEADIGSPVSSVEIRNNAEFLRGGRYPVDQTFLPAIPHNFARGTYYSRVPNIDIALGSDLLRNVYQFSFLGLFIVVFCITLYKGLLRIDDTIHYLFIASILMYMLAYLIMLKLYIPVRQLEFALPVWALLVQSLLISRGIALLRTRRVRIGIRIGLITGTIIVCAVMVRISILPAHFAKRELVDVSEYTALYGALIDLPSDGLIASHPALADPIPTVTGRRVLFNTAMALPFFDKYWSEISNRARSFVEAYYSEDINEVIEFCNEFHVEYIIVRTSDFADAYLTKAHIAWEPYGTWVKEASANKHDFALPGIPDKCKLYNENGLFVISASTLKSDCD